MTFGGVDSSMSTLVSQAVNSSSDTTGMAQAQKSAQTSQTAKAGNVQNSDAAQPKTELTTQQLLKTHEQIGQKLEAFVKNTSSQAQQQSVQTSSDSFNAETLKKLRNLSKSESSSAQTAQPKADGASLLDSKINLGEVLKGVSPRKELNESQQALNRTAAAKNAESKQVSGNTAWAKSNLRQEALPYQTVRGAQAQTQTVSHFIPTVTPQKTFSANKAAAPLATTPLQNPNAPNTPSAASSSKLIMEQLTKSPFREVSADQRSKASQEGPKVVFASTFTPAKPGQIPVIPSVNAPAAAPVQDAAVPVAVAAGTAAAAAAAGTESGAAAAQANADAAMAARINSGQLLAQPGSAIAQQAQINALAANSKTVQKSNIKEREALNPALNREIKRIEVGHSFGGRPATSQVPVYSPTLDVLFQPKSKKELDQHSTPIKMALSGSVGTLEQQTYSRGSFASVKYQQAGAALDQTNMQKLSQARDYCDSSEPRMAFSKSAAKRISLFAEKSSLKDAKAEASEENSDSASSSLKESSKPKYDADGRLILSLNEMIHMRSIRLATSAAGYESTMTKLDSRVIDNQYAIEHAESRTPAASAMLKQLYTSQSSRASTGKGNDEAEAINGAILMLKLSGDETYEHSSRVVSMAMDIASELKIRDTRALHTIEYGAMFKDIGETGMILQSEPEEKQEAISMYMASEDFKKSINSGNLRDVQLPVWMVHQPRKLSDAEYEQLRAHPQRGEEMIYPLVSIRYLCPVIRSHHERWDGKGFPDGLAGDKIPIASRIIAVCDAYDALTNARQGSKTYSSKDACDLISSGGGSAFDPQCAAALVKVVQRGRSRVPAARVRPTAAGAAR